MSAEDFPYWFTERRGAKYIVDSIEELSDNHYREYENLPDRDKEYIQTALSQGASLGGNLDSNTWQWYVAMPAYDWDGTEVVFTQMLFGHSPHTEGTYIYLERYPLALNKCDECSGIPIWDIDDMLIRARTCPKCGQVADSFDDMGRASYAGLYCIPCADREPAPDPS